LSQQAAFQNRRQRMVEVRRHQLHQKKHLALLFKGSVICRYT
jgi:hypothetical protein